MLETPNDTDEMRQKAADKIDRAITGTEPPQEKELKPPGRTAFQPVKGKYRKPGTGCISQINDHLWGGALLPKDQREAHVPERVRENRGRV